MIEGLCGAGVWSQGCARMGLGALCVGGYLYGLRACGCMGFTHVWPFVSEHACTGVLVLMLGLCVCGCVGVRACKCS